MSDLDDFEPFPAEPQFPPVEALFEPGLTKRQLFAAMVFAALIRRDEEIPFINPETDPVMTELIPVWAKTAVVAADALIAALAEGER